MNRRETIFEELVSKNVPETVNLIVYQTEIKINKNTNKKLDLVIF